MSEFVESKEVKIHLADRGVRFKEFIQGLLKKCELSRTHISDMTDASGMKIFSNSFTHDSVDPIRNYQFLEKIGDSTVNKTVRFYIFRKYPNLMNVKGIKYISRLENNWKSDKYLAAMARSLGYQEFISADEDKLKRDITKLLEDTFEAFIGALETLIDDRYGICLGYKIAYTFIEKLLDKIKVKYRYDDMFDSKSIINIVNNSITSTSGVKYLEYKVIRENTPEYQYHDIDLVIDIADGKGPRVVGRSVGVFHSKQDAEKDAASKALKVLESRSKKEKGTSLVTAFNMLNKLRQETRELFKENM